LSSPQRETLKQKIASGDVDLDDEESAVVMSTWEFWARDEQLAPRDPWWTYWLILAGRGYGKTRAGGEWVRDRATSGTFAHVNLIAATADDARDIMIEGESGILAICPAWERPDYRSSKRRLEWPNGCRSLIFTADEPERLRGKQHESLWADELAAWRYPEAWDQAMLGLRIGPDPRAVVTTTPKPTALVRALIADPDCVVTRGSTYENRANLSKVFYNTVIKKYEGTRLGRQELDAEVLDDTPGALWTSKLIEDFREQTTLNVGRIVVAIDPAGGTDEDLGTSEVGIVAAGMCLDRVGHCYVLADRSRHGSPETWAAEAVRLYRELYADRIVVEKNFGGDMVRSVIHAHDRSVPVRTVTASRSKRVRAEPVAALYEQGRVHHVGLFGELEDQMTTWVPDAGMDSPDRLDALVWALTELMVDQHDATIEAYKPSVDEGREYRKGDLVLVSRDGDPFKYHDRTD